MALNLVPLALALGVVGLLAAGRYSRRVELLVTRTAYRLRGDSVIIDDERRRLLRSAGIGTPYRVYVSVTSLCSVLAAAVGTVVGFYVGDALLRYFGIRDISEAVPDSLFTWVPLAFQTDGTKRVALLLVAALLFSLVCAGVVHVVRWSRPSFAADTRRRQIDAGMPRTVAFIYALSRGGMAFPDVMRAFARNRSVFGAGAEEVGVGVRDIDLFGSDVVTAVKDVSRRTPSEGLRKFTENLSSVLQSGRNLSTFLENEYERYREEAEEQQEEILELLATTAEVYVTVVVAGMLFLITILLVMGLTTGDTLLLVQLVTYVVLPATNVLFIAYLSEITQPLRATRESSDRENRQLATTEAETLDVGSNAAERSALPDGGVANPARRSDGANLARLRAFLSVRRAYRALSTPVESLVSRPELLLAFTVPLAGVYVALQLPAVLDGGFDPRLFDDVLIQATLFVMATYAVVYEVSRRRLERMEDGLPDLLERLASLNEAGVSIVSSFDRVRRSDVGDLNPEVERIWRDIQWGSTVEQALARFQRRVETPAVTRIVTLINSAMRASNDIGPVLRIAAEQARSDRQLRSQRRQTMFTYLVVIYVSFLVFVVVVAAIDMVLIPSLPDAPIADSSGAVGTGLLQVTQAGTDAYRLAFFHAALIQACLSGLTGGQMGEGSIKDGVKHATIMLGITYLVFLLFNSISVGL